MSLVSGGRVGRRRDRTALLAWGQEAAATRASAGVKSELRARLLAHAMTIRGPRFPTTSVGGAGGPGDPGIDALDPYFARYLPQLVLAAIIRRPSSPPCSPRISPWR